MQRHHQRPGPVGCVIFGHVEREAASAARLVVVVENAAVLGGRSLEPGFQCCIVAQRGVDKEIADRRKFRRERIERLLRARRVTQRAKHRDQIAIAMLHLTQAGECRKRRIARSLD